MKRLYSEAVCSQMEGLYRKSREMLWGVLLVWAAVVAALLLSGPLSRGEAAVGTLATFLGLLGGYWILQKRILPLKKTSRLIADEMDCQGERISGTFLGYADALGVSSGVLVRRLQLDMGERVHTESVAHEVYIPVLLETFPVSQGEKLALEISHNLVVGYELAQNDEWKPHVRMERSGYQISKIICLLLAVVCVVGWASLYGAVNAVPRRHQLNVAVCALGRSEQNVEQIGDDLTAYDIKQANFSYMETSDAEEAALYIATYAALDADLALMAEFLYREALGCEGYVFQKEEISWLEKCAGGELRFVYDESGAAAGVVLFDPEDPDYSDRFPGLRRWLQVDETDAYVLMINPNSPHISAGAPSTAAGLLLDFLQK